MKTNKASKNGIRERNGKFQARITHKGKRISLGSYSTYSEALNARLRFIRKLQPSTAVRSHLDKFMLETQNDAESLSSRLGELINLLNDHGNPMIYNKVRAVEFTLALNRLNKQTFKLLRNGTDSKNIPSSIDLQCVEG